MSEPSSFAANKHCDFDKAPSLIKYFRISATFEDPPPNPEPTGICLSIRIA